MPTMTDGQILKVDDKGRIRIPRERREALLEEFGKSGMTATAFAKWAGIKYPTFAAWVRKRQGAQKASGSEVGSSSGSTADNALHWVARKLHEKAEKTSRAGKTKTFKGSLDTLLKNRG